VGAQKIHKSKATSSNFFSLLGALALLYYYYYIKRRGAKKKFFLRRERSNFSIRSTIRGLPIHIKIIPLHNDYCETVRILLQFPPHCVPSAVYKYFIIPNIAP
jgi:hypothetical protein